MASAANKNGMTEALALLAADGLCFGCNGSTLVADASLSLSPGEIMAIIGPNGAGKTTLLRLLAGLAAPDKGRVSLAGEDLHRMPRSARARRVAVVGQLNQVDARLGLRDYVALGRTPHLEAMTADENAAKVDKALTITGIDSLARLPFGVLSGGERQRAHMARAICQEPELLFLDEPTNHLDPRARGELLSVVAGLGIGVVAVLHDLSLAPRFAHKVAVMEQGRIICCGPAREVLSNGVVERVFGVDLLRLKHPSRKREEIYYVDVRLGINQ